MKPTRSLTLAVLICLAGALKAQMRVEPVSVPSAASASASADCNNPGVSDDGRFVVFVSLAENLVTNDANSAQ